MSSPKLHKESPLILIRVLHASIQRVPSSINNLNSNASFILLDEATKKLIVWIGKFCSLIDSRLTENLGSEISNKELKISTASSHIPIITEAQESAAPADLFSSFLKLLNSNLKEYNQLEQNRMSHINNTEVILSILEKNEQSFSKKDIASVTPNDKGIIHKINFNFSSMGGAAVAILVVRPFIYIWIPSGTPRNIITSSQQFISSTALSKDPLIEPLIERQGLEHLMFKEFFTASSFVHMDNNMSSSTNTSSTMSKRSVVSLRPISKEVDRMMSTSFGTLHMLGEGGGDHNREGLRMSLLDDETAALKVWRIAGSSRELLLVDRQRMFIFSSSTCYAILFTCKAGSKAVC
eukprot:gene10651-22234_t